MISESSSLLSNKLREDTHYDWLGNELDNIKAEMLTFVIPLTKSEREQADKENFINLKCEIYRTDENKVEIDHEGNSICCDHVEIVKSGSSEDLKSPSSEGSFFNDIMNTLNKKLETNDVNDEVEDKVSDKNKKERLQLDLEPLLDEDGAESLDNFPSANTPVSVATTSVPIEDKKSGKLKRVSFGSSKGSMVETLFYETFSDDEKPLISIARNRPYLRYPVLKKSPSTQTVWTSKKEDKFLGIRADANTSQRPASRVRVTFYESERPLTVSSPEPSEGTEPPDLETVGRSPSPHLLKTAMGTVSTPEHGNASALENQTFSEGTDNPFRPDGDLSREADELVHLIKEGRPFSEVVKPGSPSQSESHDQVDSLISPEKETILLATPPASPIKNGSMTQVAPVEAPPSPKHR
ncbi:uncharacterized protein LOC136033960 isoform X2 [Artemia franciscana]|uniref:uncharacterized protein LOC136033960 isoform X2 n=1 Tax=Artemia franciscana TaxID=6661 RepID=UPI0032D9F78D